MTAVHDNSATPEATNLTALSELLDFGGEESAADQDSATEESAEDMEVEAVEDSEDAEGASEDAEEEESDEEAEDEPKEESTLTIKRDGKEVSLKQSEVIELAQKGYDYTQKTQALAEDRKGLEALKSEVSQLHAQRREALESASSRLQALEHVLKESLGQPPSLEMVEDNPGRYLSLKAQYDARMGKLQQVLEASEATQSETQRHRQAALVEQANETEKALGSTLPGWNDEVMNGLADYLIKSGVSPDTAIEAFVNKGVWELAHKAKQFDQLQAKKAALKPTVPLKKVQKPSAARTTNQAEVKLSEKLKAHRTNPSINSLADLL